MNGDPRTLADGAGTDHATGPGAKARPDARAHAGAEQILGQVLQGVTAEDPYPAYHRLRQAAPALLTVPELFSRARRRRRTLITHAYLTGGVTSRRTPPAAAVPATHSRHPAYTRCSSPQHLACGR